MSVRVTLDDVRHVSMLARLGLSDERAAALARELSTILEHMEALGRVDTTGVPEHSAFDRGMRLRDDQGPPDALGRRPEAFAPATREALLLVPRLATHEDVE